MKLLTLTISKTEEGKFVGSIQIGPTNTSRPFDTLRVALDSSAAFLLTVSEEIETIMSIFTLFQQLEAKGETARIIDKLKENKDAN